MPNDDFRTTVQTDFDAALLMREINSNRENINNVKKISARLTLFDIIERDEIAVRAEKLESLRDDILPSGKKSDFVIFSLRVETFRV